MLEKANCAQGLAYGSGAVIFESPGLSASAGGSTLAALAAAGGLPGLLGAGRELAASGWGFGLIKRELPI